MSDSGNNGGKESADARQVVSSLDVVVLSCLSLFLSLLFLLFSFFSSFPPQKTAAITTRGTR